MPRKARRLAAIAVLTILGTLLLYAAAYLALVRVGGVEDTFSSSLGQARRRATEPIVLVAPREVRYRWGGRLAFRLFELADSIDRDLRPGMWKETFVFKPLPREDGSHVTLQ